MEIAVSKDNKSDKIIDAEKPDNTLTSKNVKKELMIYTLDNYPAKLLCSNGLVWDFGWDHVEFLDER